jgi:hypothetical protein
MKKLLSILIMLILLGCLVVSISGQVTNIFNSTASGGNEYAELPPVKLPPVPQSIN